MSAPFSTPPIEMCQKADEKVYFCLLALPTLFFHFVEYNGVHIGRPAGLSHTKEEQSMETMRKKLDKLRGQSARGEQVSMDASALLRFANGGSHFL